MNNLPIVGKLATLIAAFGIFTILVATYSVSQISKINSSYTEVLTHDSIAALALGKADKAFENSRAAIGDLLMLTDDDLNAKAIGELRDAHDRFLREMDTAIAAASDDAALPRLKARGLDVLDGVCQATVKAAMIATAASDVAASQATFLRDCQPRFPSLSAEISVAAQRLSDMVETRNLELSAASQDAIDATFVIIIAGLVVVMTLAIFAARSSLVQPIKLLAATMVQLANGDLAAPVMNAERRDEVGSMAKAVRIFKDNGIRARQLEDEAQLLRDKNEKEREANATIERARSEEMQVATAQLAEGLQRLATGDLTFQLAEPFADDFESLRADYNAAVAQLRETLANVQDATGSIDSGTTEISVSAGDLSKRTEQQAASLEQTAAALDEITTNVVNASDRVNEARKLAQKTNDSAARSGVIVADAVTAMQKIETSSQQISNIIGVIDDIAFQTNLLALNAGVEAARAGEAGKGFAVVAQEVRELAQRSAVAAREITSLIRTSTTEVEGGVRLVSQTGVALKSIESNVVEINRHMDAIATSAKEQAAGLSEVNTAVNHMDQVTQRNAAMVEESNAASASLKAEVTTLRRIVSRFDLGPRSAKLDSDDAFALSRRPRLAFARGSAADSGRAAVSEA
ncbi:methyl-accepting chemotaxis protein [Rhizobium sp. BK376]|uniref:methyl-accepting chemotaxis protein n=1 Tax=Rhizobium sp. BK376 TaxID=2512149 RepID=UPI00104FDA89|nr:methyl-accepting chemotaxis protein [Rhizobium sp. BK376]TCR73372.1 methyl-accepting chemotaxis protein [Rhizobium sp. BK376]